jgi:hypothetical protein
MRRERKTETETERCDGGAGKELFDFSLPVAKVEWLEKGQS